MSKAKIYLVLLLTTFLFTQSCAQEGQKILFLTFQFIKGEPHLVGMVSVNGELKSPKVKKQMPSEISFDVVSANDESLYSGFVEDPSKQTLEYPGDNGEIKNVKINKDTTETIIRVPYSEEIQKIILKRQLPAKTLQKNGSAAYSFNIDHSLIKKD